MDGTFGKHTNPYLKFSLVTYLPRSRLQSLDLGDSPTIDGVSASRSRAPTPDVAITLASNLRRRLLVVVVNRNRVVDGFPSISECDCAEWRLDQDFSQKDDRIAIWRGARDFLWLLHMDLATPNLFSSDNTDCILLFSIFNLGQLFNF
ncbi:hypothetical protein TIFTF001_047736 [Ficus carica]|uniref:Uncharacterized protein n=1 Tax=Ficus carica TaxID=3494 RepID=A0AA87ZDM8_FICCA|nr:hypothetical protein TIFTF001_047736 [Ficus carica]